jgi:hypothetical protein
VQSLFVMLLWTSAWRRWFLGRRRWFELPDKAAYNPSLVGGVAQLGERLVRNQEVVSSILILSTTEKPKGG